jgi:segregation and condensation protein B
MNPAELKGSLEAIIYAADEPATLDQLAKATETDKDELRKVLDEMIAACAADERGIEIRRVARGYKFSTKPQYHEVVRTFIKNLRPSVRLSMPALETLAVIAYKQPITLPEIQEIRGVNSSGVIQTLLEKRLVTTAGRKAVIGRPILYRTTKEFLVRFGLNDVDELPSLKEFEQLAREALGPEAGIEIVPESEAGERVATESAAEAGSAPESTEESAETESEAPAEAEVAESGAAPAEEETAGTELAADAGVSTENETIASEPAGETEEETAAGIPAESAAASRFEEPEQIESVGADSTAEEETNGERSSTP